MTVSRDAVLPTDTVKSAFLDKLNDDTTELFAIAAEVEAARGGETDLDTRLDGFDTSIAALTVGTRCPVSSNDTTPGYLNGKLLGNTDILLTEGNDGGNETLTISLKSTGQIATLTTAISTLDTDMTKLVRDAENLAFFGSIAL